MTIPLHHPAYGKALLALFVLLLLLPPATEWLGDDYYVGFVTRILILGLAATSLNLILGFGGMVSFGHAGFLGLGAYTVAILMYYGVTAAWISWPAAVLLGGLAALAIGAISLRTRGVYFIMITLAFAQMLYFVFQSLEVYGGDDGLPLSGRSTLPSGLDLSSDTTFFYVVLLLGALVMLGTQRLANARFGRVLQAIRENEVRMGAIGYPVYRYKLIAFAMAGALAGLAGALLANQTGLVSPSTIYWTQSGSLMVMVILGGVGYTYGGFLGACLMLVLEEVLSGYSTHWQLPMGGVLLAVVLFAPNGIAGLLRGRVRHV